MDSSIAFYIVDSYIVVRTRDTDSSVLSHSAWRLYQVVLHRHDCIQFPANVSQVVVKHQGKKYDVDLDPEATGETFKFQLYSLTNVEPERQKILVKGGQLKDDTPLSSLGAKKGQQFMMMGTPSGDAAAIVERPTEKIRFLEDMTEAEAAQVEGATPAGLQNLGNTCYLNSALQTLRVIPELNEALQTYKEGQVDGIHFGY